LSPRNAFCHGRFRVTASLSSSTFCSFWVIIDTFFTQYGLQA
jgi:hypothetical protein